MTRRANAARDASGRTGRDTRAVETLGSAAAAIGPIDPGLRVFLLTRGQFSLLDMVLHVLNELGPSAVSIWTWAVSDFEVDCLGGFMQRGDVTAGRLIVDRSAVRINGETLEVWRRQFGPDAVRICKNHAKLARVWNADRRVLIRGSMNLNFNPRFEQADISEGGPEFDLVAGLEDELPVLPLSCTNAEAETASGVSKAFELSQLAMFHGLKPFEGLKSWAK